MSQPKVIAGADETPLPGSGSRKGKPNKRPYDMTYRLRAARSQEAKSDSTLSEFVRAQIRRQRMRPFFAERYPGFSEHYAERHEDLGWNQAHSPEDSMPSITSGCSELGEKAGPKSDGGLRRHSWRGYAR